jgi:hypothetical protein
MLYNTHTHTQANSHFPCAHRQHKQKVRRARTTTKSPRGNCELREQFLFAVRVRIRNSASAAGAQVERAQAQAQGIGDRGWRWGWGCKCHGNKTKQRKRGKWQSTKQYKEQRRKNAKGKEKGAEWKAGTGTVNAAWWERELEYGIWSRGIAGCLSLSPVVYSSCIVAHCALPLLLNGQWYHNLH